MHIFFCSEFDFCMVWSSSVAKDFWNSTFAFVVLFNKVATAAGHYKSSTSIASLLNLVIKFRNDSPFSCLIYIKLSTVLRGRLLVANWVKNCCWKPTKYVIVDSCKLRFILFHGCLLQSACEGFTLAWVRNTVLVHDGLKILLSDLSGLSCHHTFLKLEAVCLLAVFLAKFEIREGSGMVVTTRLPEVLIKVWLILLSISFSYSSMDMLLSCIVYGVKQWLTGCGGAS